MIISPPAKQSRAKVDAHTDYSSNYPPWRSAKHSRMPTLTMRCPTRWSRPTGLCAGAVAASPQGKWRAFEDATTLDEWEIASSRGQDDASLRGRGQAREGSQEAPEARADHHAPWRGQHLGRERWTNHPGPRISDRLSAIDTWQRNGVRESTGTCLCTSFFERILCTSHFFFVASPVALCDRT